jgi:hypothetical protein
MDPRIWLDPLHTLTTALIGITDNNKAKFHTNSSQGLSGLRVAHNSPVFPYADKCLFMGDFSFLLPCGPCCVFIAGAIRARHHNSRSVGFLTGRAPPLSISGHGATQETLDGF